MNITSFKIVLIIIGISLSSKVMAANTCTVDTRSDYVSPLNIGNITASPDLPVGTILYTMKISQNPSARITCANNITGGQYLTMDNAPKSLSSWGSAQYSGAVYETGVPGIGVTIWSTVGSGKSVTLSNPVLVWQVNGQKAFAINIPIMIAFIKIGNIQPGVIKGSDLPSISIEQQNDEEAINGLPVKPITLRFSGQVNITSSSCVTPDVNVDLGSWNVNTFKGIGTSSEWRDASIILQQCPKFYGYIGNGNVIDTSSNGNVSLPEMTPNSIMYKLSPATPIINAEQGVFSVEKLSGSEASGIGIQIANGTISNNTSMNIGLMQNMIAPNTGESTFKIPLVARYIQQEQKVTPGAANGKIIFLINYQ